MQPSSFIEMRSTVVSEIAQLAREKYVFPEVEPHIQVPANEALKIAHLQAIKKVEALCQDDAERNALAWIADILESDYSPVSLNEADLHRCVGKYGKRSFYLENGALFYRHQDLAQAWQLLPMTKTSFRLDEYMKFEFIFNPEDQASAVKIRYRDGRPEVTSPRES